MEIGKRVAGGKRGKAGESGEMPNQYECNWQT